MKYLMKVDYANKYTKQGNNQINKTQFHWFYLLATTIYFLFFYRNESMTNLYLTNLTMHEKVFSLQIQKNQHVATEKHVIIFVPCKQPLEQQWQFT